MSSDPFGDSPAVGMIAPLYSIVIPCYNEQSSIAHLLAEVHAVLQRLTPAYEIVIVDDGSTDATLELLEAMARQDSRVRVLGWRRNRGQAAALYHGLHAARAPTVVTMDGDGQNDPADIPILLRALDECDMVVGIRTQRRDTSLRRLLSRIANGVRARLLGDGFADSGCALKAFRCEVVDSLLPIRTLYSFMPALALAGGFRVSQCPVHHRERRGGVSSYGLWKFLWRPAVDLVGVWWFSRSRFSFPSPRPGILPFHVPVDDAAGALRSGVCIFRSGTAGADPSAVRGETRTQA